MTKGNKKVLKNDNSNLCKFWDLNKNKNYQKSENIIRTFEKMQELAVSILLEQEVDENYEYYEYIKKVANGKTILNKFGKKLYFKLG